jgi:hypothetical protein
MYGEKVTPKKMVFFGVRTITPSGVRPGPVGGTNAPDDAVEDDYR